MFQVRAPLGAIVLWVAVVAAPWPARAEEGAMFRAALESITTAELKAHVETLSDDTFEGREAGSRGGRAAGNYVAKLLEKYGLKPAGDRGSYFQAFGSGYRNILGFMEGSDPELKNEVVLIGAHYDHVGYGRPSNSYGPTGYIHNGADDNASGTASVLETIEAFTRLPSPPKRSLLFAFWDGEEIGLLGSKHWLAQPTLGKRKVVIAVNLDMVGRLRKERLEVVGTRTTYGLRRMLSQENKEQGLDLEFDWTMREDSDHFPFYARRIPTVMLHTGLHEDYHRPSDDAHKVNVEGICKVVRILFPLANELANRPQVAGFRSASLNESAGNQALLEQPATPSPSRLGVAWSKTAKESGALTISQVTPGSAAERAGVLARDRVLEFAGRPIENEKQFTLSVLSAVSPVTLLVERAAVKEPLALNVTLGGRPVRVGFGWREDDAEPRSVLINQVISGSPAHWAGLRLRDRIYEIAGEEFATGKELNERFAKLEGPVELLIERRGRLQHVTIELPPLAK